MESAQRAMTGPGQSLVLSSQSRESGLESPRSNLSAMCPVCARFLPLPHPHLLLVGKVPKIIVEPASLLAKIDPGRDTSCSKPNPQSSVLRIANMDWNLPGLICQPYPRCVPFFELTPPPNAHGSMHLPVRIQ